MAKEIEKYDFIDLLKFIAAIFVIAIHSKIAGNDDSNLSWYILHVVFRIAVPFFFIVSGFLFGKKHLRNKEKLKENSIKQIKRLAIPFIFWGIVIIPYIVSQISFEQNVLKNIYNILRYLLFNACHLWFVLALIVAICIEYFFLKKGKLKIAVILSVILYLIAMLGNSYYFLIEGTFVQKIIDIILKIFTITRNGIFVGFPLFTLGICIAYKENDITKISNKKIYIALFIFIVTQILEASFIRGKNYKDDHSLFLSIILISAMIVMLCIKYKNIRLKRVDTKLLRNLSTGIYFMHFPLIQYMYLLVPNMNPWIVFGATTIITISINWLLLKINNKYINYVIK